MEFALSIRTVDGRPTLVAPVHRPEQLLFLVPGSSCAVEVQLCPAELEKLSRAGVKFDPADSHHRTMIDKFLESRRVPRLTGDEWSQIRKHYRALKRRAR